MFIAVACLQIVFPSVVLGVVASSFGLLAVGASVMVYAVTGRRWWSPSRVAWRFGFTTVVGVVGGCAVWLDAPLVGSGGAVAMLVGTVALIGPSERSRDRSLRRTASLLRGELKRRAHSRLALGLLASLGTATGVLIGSGPTKSVGLGVFVLSAFVERTLFFRAVAPDRMPGYR